MSRLHVDQLRTLLPDLDELRPLLNAILADSIPDPERRWMASAELDASGHRQVRIEDVEARVPGLARVAANQIESIYGAVLRGVRALAEGEDEKAGAHFLEAAVQEEAANRLQQSEAYALAAHKVTRGLPVRGPALRALHQAARAARGQGKLEAAGKRYVAAHRLAGLIEEPLLGAKAAIGAGDIAADRGAWPEAAEWYREALKLLGHELRLEHMEVYLKLSVVHRSLGELTAGAEWLGRAERVADDLGEAPNAEMSLSLARAQLLIESDAWEAAEIVLRTALDAATEAGGRISIHVKLGETLLARGRLLAAAEEARQAESAAIASGRLHRLPEVYRLLGAVAGARGMEDGFVFFERALELVRDQGLPDLEAAKTLEAYGNFADAAGRPGESDRHFRRAAEIYEKLGCRWLQERAVAAVDTRENDADPPESPDRRESGSDERTSGRPMSSFQEGSNGESDG